MNYQQVYDQIIERARKRRLAGYYETHHIIPRALGGSDEPKNLVDLTYREHFLVHWLLTKIVKGSGRRSMIYALQCMGTWNANGQRIVTSWQFDVAKRSAKGRRWRLPKKEEVVVRKVCSNDRDQRIEDGWDNFRKNLGILGRS